MNLFNKNKYSFLRSYFSLLIIITIILFLPDKLIGQDYKVEYLTTKDGLANGCIQQIIQDSKGFIWFATEGGLNRYDGYNINLYDCGQKYISEIFEDPADSGKILWIGTEQGGLFKFDRDSEIFTQYQHEEKDSNSISNNTVKCIYKDKTGIYWIATGGGGLNKFNPHTGKFKAYHNDPNDSASISSEFVFAVCEDYLGFLWVGTFLGGLDKFDPRTEKFIHYKFDPQNPHTLFSNDIFSLFEDSDKTLWIGTSWTLFSYDRENDKFVQHALEKNGYKIYFNGVFFNGIFEDKDKTLWVTSNGQGVYGINRDRENFIFFSNDLNSFAPSTVFIDNSGIIWIGTFCNGISKIIPKKKFFNYFNTFISGSKTQKLSWVYNFIEDEFNNIWIVTDAGIKKLVKGKIVNYPIFIDGIEPSYYYIIKSKSGNLWGAGSSGIIELDPKTNRYNIYTGKYITYHTTVIEFFEKLFRDSLEIASIKRVENNKFITEQFLIKKTTDVLIYSTGEGDLEELLDFGWITSEKSNEVVWKMEPDKTRYIEGNFRESIHGGPFKNREQITLITLNPGKYQLHYRSNEKHAFGNWIEGGPPKPDMWGISIFLIKNSDYNKIQSEIEKIAYHRIHWSDINSFLEDNTGRMWAVLGTEGNTVHILNKEQKQFIPAKLKVDGKELPYIRSIYKDSAGNLWLRTFDNRLIRRDITDNCEVKFKLNNYLQNNVKKLNNDAISHLYEDSKGNLWIGSDSGLFKYNLTSEKVEQFKSNEFISPNTIAGIVEDNDGKLWISTSSSIIKFDPETKSLRKYDASDGLPDMKFAVTSCYKLQNGSLVFGGSEGFVMFHPDSIKDNLVIPHIEITGFQIFNKPVILSDLSYQEGSNNIKASITLNHDQDVFSFEFASLDFTNSSQNQYAYKMEGVDPDWVYTAANRRFATYTNLDPGKYVFRVKGTNNDGIWNEAGTSIKIIILPPWWKTWWAYLLYTIVLVSVFISSTKFYLNRQRLRQKLALESEHAEKLEEVSRMKSNFFANISHEFRTPLTLILGPAEKIISYTKDEKVKNDATLISRNSKRLLALVNQLLDLAKADAGKLKLEASKGNIVSFVKGIALSFESLIESKDITLKIKSSSDLIELYFDREKMMKVMSNLLSNAFKFSPTGEGAFVSINETEDDGVQIKIKNTGVSISKTEIPKLFDRFYQADASHTREKEGTGIGLALVKELIELHHGTISVESEEKTSDKKHNGWVEFTITLPKGKSHLNEEEILISEEYEIPEINVETEQVSKSKKDIVAESSVEENRLVILVVEDNYDMREYIKESLSANYKVEEAVNGEQGIRIAQKIIPDLIISDLMMPKVDGIELTKVLKEDEKTSHIPIIILTAKSGQENLLDGLTVGADEYLIKPFDIKELEVRIHNLIKLRKKIQDKILNGGLTELKGEKKLGVVDAKFIGKVNEVIEKHLSDENFSIEEFGKEIGMSRSQFHRKLKALAGKSASLYLRSVRLNKAKKMLELGQGNISEISYEVGFSSPSYFTYCFKEEFGYPPKKIT
jgi:signal transduction histidine kinase/ligand-binding sensor domain-containing protein/DNA-binding response OmpR family regulator